ncbi:MAG: hypothetical protein WA414_19660, partial [Acidobacteriaceae bacterium]
MQPGTKTDDIHTILSRFNNWSGKQIGDRAEHLEDGVREIPYEEAMRRVRSRVRAANLAGTKKIAMEPVKSEAAVAVTETAVALPVANSNGPEKSAAVVSPTLESRVAQSEANEVKAVEALLQASKIRTRRAKNAQAALKAKPRTAAAMAELLPTVARVATVKKAAPRKKRTAVKALATKPVGTKPDEFRQVLAKSMRRGQPAVRVAKVKDLERKECVSVPLSSGEKMRLRQCAAIAGVTVPVYLRMRALGMEVPRNEARMLATAETHQAVAESMSLEESQRR